MIIVAIKIMIMAEILLVMISLSMLSKAAFTTQWSSNVLAIQDMEWHGQGDMCLSGFIFGKKKIEIFLLPFESWLFVNIKSLNLMS